MSQAHSPTRMDILRGPVWNQVLLFVIPVAATGMLELLFNASDIAIVGSFAQQARTEAVAAVGANSPIIGLIVNFFIGIAMGVNVVIARAIKENKPSLIERAVQTSVLTALLCGVLVAVAGELCSSWFLSLMNIPENVFPLALDYIRIYLAGMPAILLYNFESSVFRSIGQTKIPLLPDSFRYHQRLSESVFRYRSPHGCKRSGHCHSHFQRNQFADFTLLASP